MKRTLRQFLIAFIAIVNSIPLCAQAIPADSLYLGQTPPGNAPKIFSLPVTGSLRPLERIAITADGKEIYYGELNKYPASILRIRCMKYKDNRWQGPFNVFEGFIAPKLADNDSTIYMQTNAFNTYRSRRTDTGWTVPVPVMYNQRTHYFQKTKLGNFYASSYYENSPTDGDICRTKVVNNDTVLESLGKPINSSTQENDLFVEQNESYLIFSSNVTNGPGDMYISFKKPNNKWTNPKRLPSPITITGNNWEYGPFITTDGKYFFYSCGATTMSTYNTMWIKIDNIIDSLRKSNFPPYMNCAIPNQPAATGRLFTYTIPDTVFIDDDGNNTLKYTATMYNGAALPSWLQFDSLTHKFTGTPTEEGSVYVKVSAIDSARASVSCIFSIDVTLTGIEESKDKMNKEINLFQNYPNPFNPVTTIKFSLPAEGDISLKVFDSLGREVEEIFRGHLEAGSHSFDFDAKSIPSGIYFYEIGCNDFRLSKKMSVLK